MSKKHKTADNDHDTETQHTEASVETKGILVIEILEWETLNKVSDKNKRKMGLYDGPCEVKNIKTLEEVTPGFEQIKDIDGRVIGAWGHRDPEEAK